MNRLKELQRSLFGLWLDDEPDEASPEVVRQREELAPSFGNHPRTSQPTLNSARFAVNEDYAVDWLGLCAAKVTSVIGALPKCPHSSQHPSGKEQRQLCRTCQTIYAMLGAIQTCLGQGGEVDRGKEFEKQAYCLLGFLEDMCSSRPISTSSALDRPAKKRFPILWSLVENETRKEAGRNESREDPERETKRNEALQSSIFHFLENSYNFIDVLDRTTQSILGQLPIDGSEVDFETTEPDDHSVAQKALFPILAEYTICDACGHRDGNKTGLWHPTRLFLMNLTKSQDGLVRFDVLTSSTIDASWQDLCIGIPASTGPRVAFADEVTDRPAHNLNPTEERLARFCEIFENDDGSRVSLRLQGEHLLWLDAEVLKHQASPGEGVSLSDVLNQYTFSVREKLALSHTMALAFWQFYDSPLMNRVWSSDTTWFMLEPDSQHDSQLPLKVYISFHPDATDCEQDAMEFIKTRRLIHRCPRIQSLGILLLEIGLGKPFGCLPTVGHQIKHLNNLQQQALTSLETLKNATWKHCHHRELFIKAVSNCFELDGLKGKDANSEASGSFISRRELLHRRVVAILAYLNRSFSRADNKTTYISAKEAASELLSNNHDQSIDIPLITPESLEQEHASFNETKRPNPVPYQEPRSPTDQQDFEIAIICALTLESDAIKALFDHRWGDKRPCYDKSRGDSNTYSAGSFGRHNVVLIHMPGMGKSNAASVASNCRATFPNIKLAIVVGVCGIAPLGGGDKIVLGDVIVSDGIIQYDLGRQFSDRFAPKDTLLDSHGRPNMEIRGFLNKLKGVEGREALQKGMSGYLSTLQQRPKLKASYPKAQSDILFKATYEHLNERLACKEAGCSEEHISRLVKDTPEPTVHFGLFASGDTVMKSATHRDAIARRHGVLGFEMEGAGVWDIFPCVVIKGACDYADSHKTKEFQRYAAATAASCAKAFLDEWAPSVREWI